MILASGNLHFEILPFSCKFPHIILVSGEPVSGRQMGELAQQPWSHLQEAQKVFVLKCS